MTREKAVVGVVVKYYQEYIPEFIHNNRIGIICDYGVDEYIRYIKFDDNVIIVSSISHLSPVSIEEAKQYRDNIARQKYAMELL